MVMGASVPQTFVSLYRRPNGLIDSDEIWCNNARGGVACFEGVSHAPVQRGGGPIVPHFCDLHTCTKYEKQQPNFARWSNYAWGKFLHGGTSNADARFLRWLTLMLCLVLRRTALKTRLSGDVSRLWAMNHRWPVRNFTRWIREFTQ